MFVSKANEAVKTARYALVREGCPEKLASTYTVENAVVRYMSSVLSGERWAMFPNNVKAMLCCAASVRIMNLQSALEPEDIKTLTTKIMNVIQSVVMESSFGSTIDTLVGDFMRMFSDVYGCEEFTLDEIRYARHSSEWQLGYARLQHTALMELDKDYRMAFEARAAVAMNKKKYEEERAAQEAQKEVERKLYYSKHGRYPEDFSWNKVVIAALVIAWIIAIASAELST